MLEIEERTIHFAPLQEATDYIYRRLHHNYFGGVSRYYAPYIIRQNDGSIKSGHLRDTRAGNNEGIPFTPQVLSSNPEDTLFLIDYLINEGYSEINLNLGCPYPMVTNRFMGAGLLPDPYQIEKILTAVFTRFNGQFSVKLRSGLEKEEEIFRVIDVLNRFPIAQVFYHPRIARQLYKGIPNQKLFADIQKMSTNLTIYNGDLCTLQDVIQLETVCGPQEAIMIGRGILYNPFLAGQLKGRDDLDKEKQKRILISFHEDILGQYGQRLNGVGHLLIKMEKFWSYFSFLFPDQHKCLKRIKKANSLTKYHQAVSDNFSTFN